jgi:hypothetical protein
LFSVDGKVKQVFGANIYFLLTLDSLSLYFLYAPEVSLLSVLLRISVTCGFFIFVGPYGSSTMCSFWGFLTTSLFITCHGA